MSRKHESRISGAVFDMFSVHEREDMIVVRHPPWGTPIGWLPAVGVPLIMIFGFIPLTRWLGSLPSTTKSDPQAIALFYQLAPAFGISIGVLYAGTYLFILARYCRRPPILTIDSRSLKLQVGGVGRLIDATLIHEFRLCRFSHVAKHGLNATSRPFILWSMLIAEGRSDREIRLACAHCNYPSQLARAAKRVSRLLNKPLIETRGKPEVVDFRKAK